MSKPLRFTPIEPNILDKVIELLTSRRLPRAIRLGINRTTMLRMEFRRKLPPRSMRGGKADGYWAGSSRSPRPFLKRASAKSALQIAN